VAACSGVAYLQPAHTNQQNLPEHAPTGLKAGAFLPMAKARGFSPYFGEQRLTTEPFPQQPQNAHLHLAQKPLVNWRGVVGKQVLT